MSETTADTQPADDGTTVPTPADMDAAIRAHMAGARGGQPAAPPSQTAAFPPSEPTAPEPVDDRDGDGDDGRDLSRQPRWVQEQVRKARDEAAKYRTKVRELEPLAQTARELEAASRTDLQRHEEARQAAERERDQFRVQVAQLTAAQQHGIPGDLVHLLGSGSADEINTNAELLASKLAAATAAAAAEQPPAPTSAPPARPIESLRPAGAPGTASAPPDPDAWMRRAFGRPT